MPQISSAFRRVRSHPGLRAFGWVAVIVVVVLLLRLAQSHESALQGPIGPQGPSIANQVCAEDPQLCAAKTYFPPEGGP